MNSSFPVIETPRLTLREIQPQDAPALLAVFGNAAHMQWFGVDPLVDLAAADAMIKALAGSHRLPNPHLRWAIEPKAQSGLIGNCGLFAWNKTWRKCSVGLPWRRLQKATDTWGKP